MTEVLVYATASRAETARLLLAAACRTTGLSARLELYGTGSMYQRLGPRHAQPLPDVVLWFGPFAADAAARDGLLQPYQPAHVADAAMHDQGWRWTTLDYQQIGVVGPQISGLQNLLGVPSLAIADPGRSEVGLSIVLATLDQARQVDKDIERGWTWWQQRVQNGIRLAEDDAGAVAMVAHGAASHAISLVEAATPLGGLSPLPNTIGLAASARNVDGGKRLIDWLTSEQAGATLRLSPWQASSNGLQSLLSAAPGLDVGWGREQYAATRRRWAQSGFAPPAPQALGQGQAH